MPKGLELKLKERFQNISFLISIFYAISVIGMFFIVIPVLWLIVSGKPKMVVEIIKDETVILAIAYTFLSATLTTLISLIIAIGLGYILARKQFRGKGLITAVIDLPMSLPHSVAGIALLMVFGRTGIIGQFFQTKEGTIFTRSLLGIVIAQMFVSAPILIQGAREAFEMIDPELEEFSHVLGANNYRTFKEILWPLSKSSLFASAILTWARASSEFGAVMFMAYYPLTAPILVYDFFFSQGLEAARNASIILLILSTIVFALVKWASSSMKHYRYG